MPMKPESVNTMTKYIFDRKQEDGTLKAEAVFLEPWRWEAYYIDGTVLKQFDKIDEDHGVFHQFAEIDQTKLAQFRMVNDTTPPLILMCDPAAGNKLIHFYRNIGLDFMGEVKRIRLYFFGYETLSGQKVLTCIAPDGSIINTDDADKITVT